MEMQPEEIVNAEDTLERMVCDVQGRDISPRLPLVDVEDITEVPDPKKRLPFDL